MWRVGKTMNQEKRRGLLAALLVLVLLAALIPSASAGQRTVSKLIHVVYDDSGSMSDNNNKRWCQAKYAMEVFGAMLGEDDLMNIYPMGLLGKVGLAVRGDDPNRVAAIHDMNPNANGSTYFQAVRGAGNDLLNASDEYERWLVILTDGGFNEGVSGAAEVQSTLDTYNENGIKTIFLAINTKVYVRENPGKGGWVLSAADGVDILNKVTAAANQIFEHQALPASRISESGKEVTLDIDLSTNEVIVFAQGENVKIGSMSLNGNTIKATAIENLKYSEVKPQSVASIDKTLKGVLAVYKGNFEAGQFTVELSGATTAEYYYRPDVMVNCELYYQSKSVMMGDELYAGEYQAVMNFVEPSTRRPVSSELLDGARFTLVVDNNGQETRLLTSPGDVKLNEGNVTLTVIAELPGNVVLTDSKKYRVIPEPVKLNLAFETDQPFYTYADLREGRVEYRLISTRIDGTPLTADESAQAIISIQDDKGIHWTAEPGGKPGEWILRPSIVDESALESGDLRFPTDLSFKIGEQPFRGDGEFNMPLERFSNANLVIEVTVPQDTNYELPDIRPSWLLPNLHPRLFRVIQPVELRLLDANGQPVSQEVAEGIDLSFRCSNGSTWIMEPSQNAASWILVPERGLKFSLIGKDGNSDLTIEASGAVGDYLYRGTGSVNVFFGPLNLFWLLVYTVSLAVILFILSGFLFRKKLKLRGLNPHCRLVTKKGEEIQEGQTIRIKRKLTWWAPERVPCSDPDMHCNFPDLEIVATGGRVGGSSGFKIINWNDIEVRNVIINYQQYEKNEDLKDKIFSLTGFTISSIANGNPDKVRGFFKFT